MVEFPIIGPYRDLLMALELIIIFIVLQNSLYFFQKYLNNRKNEVPSFVEFDWGVIFLTFAASGMAYIFSAFFYVIRIHFLFIGYMSVAAGGLIFSYHVESTKIINSKYFFTIFTGFVIILQIIIFIVAPSLSQTFAYLAMGPAYTILFLYFLKVCKKLWTGYKLHSIGLFLAVTLWFVGFMGTADMAVNLFGGLYIRVIGDIAIIAGMILIGIFLNYIPSLSEIGWQQKIKYIILLTHSGICVYNENFREKRELREIILAGALSGIKLYMEETLKSFPKLKTISKENEVFLLEEGKYIIGVLVVEQELEILKYLLKKIVYQFEEFFQNLLINWNGDTNIFKPTKNILNNIFSIEKYI
jgi:hypothetical protein